MFCERWWAVWAGETVAPVLAAAPFQLCRSAALTSSPARLEAQHKNDPNIGQHSIGTHPKCCGWNTGQNIREDILVSHLSLWMSMSTHRDLSGAGLSKGRMRLQPACRKRPESSPNLCPLWGSNRPAQPPPLWSTPQPMEIHTAIESSSAHMRIVLSKIRWTRTLQCAHSVSLQARPGLFGAPACGEHPGRNPPRKYRR